MSTIRTLDLIITKRNTTYGAPIGRNNVGIKPADKRIYDSAVHLKEGYDKGGAYWGCGRELRVEYTKDLSYVSFYRVNN